MITHDIIGDDRQAVVLTLVAGDEVRAEAGAMTDMTDGIEMDARLERVWIQTLPFSRLADRIMRAHRGDKEDVKRDFGGTLGAIGDLIGGE
jgi:uncharacterized protein (AIM24 family)